MTKRIILAVSGSISAYKAADLTSRLKKKGYDVHVIMTEAAQAFITPLCKPSVCAARRSNTAFPHRLPHPYNPNTPRSMCREILRRLEGSNHPSGKVSSC